MDSSGVFSNWAGLPRSVAWAIAFAMILGGIFYVTQGPSTESMEPLFGGRPLRDLELDQVEMAFGAAGLTDWLRRDGEILIPRDTRHEYLAALDQSSALPYELKSNVEEAFSGGKYFESESKQKLRHQDAKARDLGNKIATFSDIAWASVVYDEQNAGGFERRTIQSASVLLIPKDGKPIAPGRIRMIQEWVCGSYAGMKPDQVTVTDTSARKTYSGSDDAQSRRQRQAEYELEQRLTELLGGYQGLHIAATSIAAGSADSMFDASAADSANNKNARPSRQDSIAGGLVMRVSIGVPESQFHSQWINDYRATNPGHPVVTAPTPQQLATAKSKVLENIRDAVVPFVATADGEDDQAVRVWSFPGSRQKPNYLKSSPASIGLPAITTWVLLHAWVVVPIVSLLFIGATFWFAAIRMRLRNSNLGDPDATDRDSVFEPEPASHAADPVSNNEGTSLRDDLAELVESNPELAAQITHSWIAEAA
jgi:flagellar biosynthesis/type III secretory pathway M-ring protein FliF/YscJ